jgi:phosphoribosylcarboxyaminoimidazole (NCAIR) mutase
MDNKRKREIELEKSRIERILNIKILYSIDNMPKALSVATFTASVVASPNQAVDVLATSRYNIRNRGQP